MGSLAALFLIQASLADVARAETTAVTLDIVVDPSLRVLRGTAKIRIVNTSVKNLNSAHLWLFPQRLTSRPKGLTEVEEEWMFPAGFSPGSMKILRVRDTSGQDLKVNYPEPTLAKVELKKGHPVGEVLELQVSFETIVPERYGPFGRAGDQTTLDGGFFPRPPPLQQDGYQDHAPPDRLSYSLRLRTSEEGVHAVVNGELKKLAGEAHWDGMEVAERVSLTLLKRFYVTRLRQSGVDISLVHRRGRVQAPDDDGLQDLTAIDTQGQIVATVGLALPFLERLKTLDLPRRIVLVETPLRRDLAIEAPGMVLVSDRAFVLPGLERFRRLHRVALLRSVVGALVRRQVGDAQALRWRDRVVDLVALELVERWEDDRYGSRADLSRALSAGSFVAQVDEVLYAPQIPLQHVFFRPVDDTDRFRDRFQLFSHKHPNGHRIHVKLQNRAKEGSVSNLVDEVLGGAQFQSAYRKHFQDPSEERLRQWDHGYPSLNYRLASSRKGRDSSGHYLDVVIEQQGDQKVTEPVTVVVWDVEDKPVYATWTGEGMAAPLRIRTRATPERVQIDPKHRLLEVVPAGQGSPREDNQNFDPWKFLIKGLSLGFASSDQSLSVGIVSSLKPSFSADHTLFLEPYESGFGTGMMSTYYHHFGDLVRPNLRRYYLGVYLGGEWQRQSELWESGLRASLAIGVGGSTYVSRVNPTSGSRWALNASLKVGHQDDSTLAFRFLGDFAHLFPLGDGHVMALRLSAATAFGDMNESNRWRLGGAGRVRSFGLLAQTGNHRILGSAEWRHRWGRGLNINLAQLAWVKSIQGVLFFDAALLANDMGALFQPSSLFVGAGYGLRIVYHVFGVHPTVLGLDFSMPLVTGRDLQVTPTLPFSILARAGQSF